LDHTSSSAFVLDETILRIGAPLVGELLFPESHAAMNLIENAIQPLESNPVSSRELPDEFHSHVRVEPCEFERLLQRSMEILSIRAQGAAASRS
jgi:hypothetical protein